MKQQQELHAKRKRGEEGVPRTVDQCLQSAVNGRRSKCMLGVVEGSASVCHCSEQKCRKI